MTTKKMAFTAPHSAASETGMNILKLGGSATEAMVAAAAVISVVYPHMNSIGGDSFWLIDYDNDETPLAIDACGRSASNVQALLQQNQLAARGITACITQAATIAGWQLALAADTHARLPLSTLLADAIRFAENGIEVSHSLACAIEKVLAEDSVPESFTKLYAPHGRPYKNGDVFKNPALALTFKTLAERGLADFYQGETANKIVRSLQSKGSVISAMDHATTVAMRVKPLSVDISCGRAFNLPAPTQGVHSLQILAIVDQLQKQAVTEADWAHLIVEATKQSFADRETSLTDPNLVSETYHQALQPETLAKKAQAIDLNQAASWPIALDPGDTIWMGALDARGQMVSFIQSVYWEFGAAEVIEDCGFVWNNRGVSFSLEQEDINVLAANKKPRHTLNPAFFKFNDGGRMVYGTMGGDGQPQTQATLFSRFVWQDKSLLQAIAQGRWLLGRTWGQVNHDLKVEADLAEVIADDLNDRGHVWHSVASKNEMMGHAGAIYVKDDCLQAASDPRSDGLAILTGDT